MENSPLEGLHAGFVRAALLQPNRPAIEVGAERVSYSQLLRSALQVAETLPEHSNAPQPRVGILANRSVQMYAGILGTLMRGGVVVPLNPGFPAERTRQMIELAEVDALIVDAAGSRASEALLDSLVRPLRVVSNSSHFSDLSSKSSIHHLLPIANRDPSIEVSSASAGQMAYLFFTSGSTGVPKGVGVLHSNVERFVAMSRERYAALGISREDRFSQFYDITFDSSMFDLFVGWSFGACLCCPTLGEWINPNKYIVDRALTVIDIVPSTGHMMDRGNGWRPNRFPLLRLARFGGEALSADLAAKLADAAPHAAIDNVYGPTECTVDASYYRWDRERSPTECAHGVVPIGTAGPRVGLRVVDTELREVPIGSEGELLISGPQVTPGYWKDPDRTARSFVRIEGSDIVHYRTGDLVRRVPDDQPIPYLGRLDYQIKIAGVRIELGEIEQALRQASGSELAVAVGWPLTIGGASGVVGFVAQSQVDGAAIRQELKNTLPAVMVPKEVRLLEELPLNVNGKVDRKILLEMLRGEHVNKT